MLLNIAAIIANAVFYIVLHTDLYTDRAMMADGTLRTWQHSPVSRMYVSDRQDLLYLQLALTVVSVITCALALFGVKNKVIRIVQIVSTIGAAAMFVIIIIIAGTVHPRYA